MTVDWMWCYENPKEAAAELDRLQLVSKAAEELMKHFRDGKYYIDNRSINEAVEAVEAALRRKIDTGAS